MHLLWGVPYSAPLLIAYLIPSQSKSLQIPRAVLQYDQNASADRARDTLASIRNERAHDLVSNLFSKAWLPSSTCWCLREHGRQLGTEATQVIVQRGQGSSSLCSLHRELCKNPQLLQVFYKKKNKKTHSCSGLVEMPFCCVISSEQEMHTGSRWKYAARQRFTLRDTHIEFSMSGVIQNNKGNGFQVYPLVFKSIIVKSHRTQN